MTQPCSSVPRGAPTPPPCRAAHFIGKCMATTPTKPRELFQTYASELYDLVRSGASKDQILNGANGKHGINHLNEIFTMLPDSPSAEFKVKA